MVRASFGQQCEEVVCAYSQPGQKQTASGQSYLATVLGAAGQVRI